MPAAAVRTAPAESSAGHSKLRIDFMFSSSWLLDAAILICAAANMCRGDRNDLLRIVNSGVGASLRPRLCQSMESMTSPNPEARVLLVDDDRELCQMLTEYLDAEHFEVKSVHDGGDALQ